MKRLLGVLGILVLALSIACGPQESGGETANSGSSGDPGRVGTATPWFDELAESRGLTFQHRSGHKERNLFPEIVAGGVALFDMDGDGDLDAYMVQSGSLTEDGNPQGANQLFENDGSGRFTDVTAARGGGDRGYGMGVTAGDYDADGDVDLYVTNLGPDVLLQNQGDGSFKDVTGASGISNPSWGTSAAFVDYDLDGNLDLYVTNYVNWSIRNEQDCYNNAGMLDYCLPTNYNAPAMDRLFRNLGKGSFRDVTEQVGLNLAFGNGLGVVINDFDSNGWPDIFVANDTMMNQLWMNQDGKSFVDESLLRGCALDEHGQTKAGMGVSSEDLDNDGDTDLLVVNLEGQTDSYYRNDEGRFTDQTGRVGLGSASRFHTRFGIGFIDFNNDGRLDLYQANGRVIKNPESTVADTFAEANALFTQGEDGRFQQVMPKGGVAETQLHTSRGAAFGDVDNDGGIDAVVVNRDGPAYLLLNRAPDRGQFVRFRVVDPSGRDELHARVTAEVGGQTLHRFARAAFSYCAANDPRVHFGLGENSKAVGVTVTWIDGSAERFGDFEAGTTTELRRGGGEAL